MRYSHYCLPATGFGKDNFGVVLQLVKAAIGDHISWIDAFHLCGVSIGYTGLDTLHVRRVVLDHINECCLAVVLDCRRRDQRRSMQRIDQ